MKGQPMKSLTTVGTMSALTLLLGGCTGTAVEKTDDLTLATQVSDAVMAACPVAQTNDEDARHLCAAKLSDDKFLGRVMQEPFLWGGQKAGAGFNPEESS